MIIILLVGQTPEEFTGQSALNLYFYVGGIKFSPMSFKEDLENDNSTHNHSCR